MNTYTIKYTLNNQFIVKNDLSLEQVNTIKRQKNVVIKYEHQNTSFDHAMNNFVNAIKDGRFNIIFP
jgi:hypothetical protein